MKLLTTSHFCELVSAVGFDAFNRSLIRTLEEDFSRWERFHRSPRHAVHYPHGVIELMPMADNSLYAFKYVNGHPGNTRLGKLSVVALGLLADVDTGYPRMLCEMTLLTAFRTAATAALAARYLARSDSRCLALIGTGAQAEFQVASLRTLLPLQSLRYFDLDPGAMEKLARNLKGEGLELRPACDVAEAVDGADVIVTATAAKRRNRILTRGMILPGVHIHAMGGDCPGKTELAPDLLDGSKIVVEYLAQSRDEGEIQNRPDVSVHAELWELVTGRKPGRVAADEITLFDAVGFALEDFSALRLVDRLSDELGIGDEVDLIPEPGEPKDLYSLLVGPKTAPTRSQTRRSVTPSMSRRGLSSASSRPTKPGSWETPRKA